MLLVVNPASPIQNPSVNRWANTLLSFLLCVVFATPPTLGAAFTPSKTYVNGGVDNPDVTYTYEPGTSLRASMSDRTGTTTYQYDEVGRPTWRFSPHGTFSYVYDESGQLINLNVPQGVTFAYEWDALGRLGKVTGAGGEITYHYDAGNNLTNLTLPNGISTDYAHDQLNRVTNLVSTLTNSTTLAHFGYQRDLTGKRIYDTNYVNSVEFTQSYLYDNLNRLTQDILGMVDPGDPANPLVDTTTYGMDAEGNRTSFQFDSTTGTTSSHTQAYDTNDRITGDTYDANGNTLTAGDVYDFENRLIHRGNTFSFVYDGDGNRILKFAYGANRKTIFYVDAQTPTGYAQVIGERYEDLQGNWQGYQFYTYRLDLHHTQYETAINQYEHAYYGYDGHGSVRYLTDDTGVITDTYDYDAYGSLISSTTTSGNPTPNVYLY
jgi:YD repeat-containing protein